MSDDLIAVHGSEPKLMPFLHLPIQSGADNVLKKMNRKQWEYKEIEEVNMQGGRLKELGSEGWELIMVLPERNETGGARNQWIFKRELVHER